MKISIHLLVVLFSFGVVSCGEEHPKVKPVQQNLDSLLGLYPDSVPLLIEHSKAMISELDYTSAVSDAAKAFRLDSNNIEARKIYAEVLNNKPNRTVADVQMAQRHYKYIIKKEPKNTKALVGLATTYSQQQDYDSSFKYLNEALRIDPKCRDAYVVKGSNYRWLGDKERTKSSYETAVQQDPEFFEAYIMLGSLYQADSNVVCLQYYTTALQLHPNDLDAIYALAYAKHEFEDYEGAKALYRRMASDTSEYYVSRGLFHQAYIKQFTDFDMDSAIYYYSSALTTNPKYVEAWYNLGLCHEKLKNKPQALQAYSKTLKYARQLNYEDNFIEAVEKTANKLR
jgi:tetratricopeptide (TPR) repeat protein